MKIAHQIRAFEQILESYDGTLPLHRFLLAYFKRNKKMGSSDRRWASRYVYSFFRLGNVLSDIDRVERLAVADFLCNATGSLVIDTHLQQFKEQVNLPLKAKLTLIMDLYPAFKMEDIFPFSAALLSDNIDKEAFFASFLIQPDLFIRVQKNHSLKTLNTLKDAGVQVHDLSETTFAMPNGTKLETIIPEQEILPGAGSVVTKNRCFLSATEV